jgi:hypothetical protein
VGSFKLWNVPVVESSIASVDQSKAAVLLTKVSVCLVGFTQSSVLILQLPQAGTHRALGRFTTCNTGNGSPLSMQVNGTNVAVVYPAPHIGHPVAAVLSELIQADHANASIKVKIHLEAMHLCLLHELSPAFLRLLNCLLPARCSEGPLGIEYGQLAHQHAQRVFAA